MDARKRAPNVRPAEVTKDALLGIFRTAQNNCKLVYASLVLFAHEDMPSAYGKWSAALNIPRPFDEGDVIALLQDRSVSKIAFSELYDTVHRAAVKELFEISSVPTLLEQIQLVVRSDGDGLRRRQSK